MVINVSSLTMGCGARARSARMALKKRTNSKSLVVKVRCEVASFAVEVGQAMARLLPFFCMVSNNGM